MKKITLFLILFSCFVFKLIGDEVDRLDAKAFAKKFIQITYGDQKNFTTLELTDLECAYIDAFVFEIKNEGWVIVSNDDCLPSVIAYSHEGQFDRGIDKRPVVFNYFKELNKQIKVTKEYYRNSKNIIHKSWDLSNFQNKSTLNVKPLIPVKWNQNGGWNRFCPEDANGPGGHVYVGCVAVAMAQAMTVYKYPTQGQGEHSFFAGDYGEQSVNYGEAIYNWDAMSNTTPDDNNALLLYHCSVSVNMGYGPNGSGSYTRYVAAALKKYYNYDYGVKAVERENYAEEDWIELMKSELDAGRPLVYGGNPEDGATGHAFNIDGYDNSGMFHLNWGWSGSMNGYFLISSLTPGSYDFSFFNKAIIGIKPVDNGPKDIILSNNWVYADKPEGTFVGKVSVDDPTPEDEFTFELHGALTGSGAWATASFYIENDSLKTSRVLDLAWDNPTLVYIKAIDMDGTEFEKKFYIEVKKENVNTSVDIDFNNRLKLYPNPADNILNFGIRNTSFGYKIYSIDGKLVKEKSKVLNYENLDVSSFQKGMYILEIISGEQRVNKKFMIQ